MNTKESNQDKKTVTNEKPKKVVTIKKKKKSVLDSNKAEPSVDKTKVKKLKVSQKPKEKEKEKSSTVKSDTKKKSVSISDKVSKYLYPADAKDTLSRKKFRHETRIKDKAFIKALDKLAPGSKDYKIKDREYKEFKKERYS